MAKRFSELASEFLSWAEKCLRPSTCNVYRHYFAQWIKMHGDLPIDETYPRHLAEFSRTWHHCQAIKRLFGWAVNEAGLLASHPLGRVKGPRKGRRRRIFTRHEAAHFLRACPPDLRALLLGYRETFARPQELRLACWDDLYSDNPNLTIDEALAEKRVAIVLFDFKDGQKREDDERPRVILLSPRACRLLQRLRRSRPTATGPIFVTRRRRSWTANALRCRFRRLRELLGVTRDKRGETLVPYTFRHTGATQAAALGVRDRLLADVLGHIETKTTARYCHLQLEHLRAAMGKVWR